jgi:hypothetical protein
MPYTPTIKTSAQLITEIGNLIKANANREITGNLLGQLLADITGSLVSKIDNVNLLGLSEYDGTRAYKAVSKDCCTKDGSILQCTTDTQGTFDATKWKVISGYTAVTRAALITLIGGSNLSPGVTYFISDRNILVKALTTTLLDPHAVAIKRVPRYGENNPDGFAIVKWIPYIQEANAYVLDLSVAYGGKVYTLNALNNDKYDTPDISTKWDEIATSSNAHYKNVYLAARYLITEDIVLNAADEFGNYISLSPAFRAAKAIEDDKYLDEYRWGDPEFRGNYIIDGKLRALKTCTVIEYCYMFPGSSFEIGIDIGESANTYLAGEGSTISSCIFESNCEVQLFKIGSFSGVVNCRFLSGSVFTDIRLNDGVLVELTLGINYAGGIIPPTGFVKAIMIPNYSNIVVDVDIDDIVTFGVFLNIQDFPYAGTINLTTSDPSPTYYEIREIVGAPLQTNWPFKITCSQPQLLKFSPHETNPASSKIYFDPNDTVEPFDGSANGFIIFETFGYTNVRCLSSKEIL